MLETWLSQYGYPILILGTFLEGETVLLLGGLAAHLGYLSLDKVIACGFLGTLFGDQLYFFLGRRHGNALLSKWPSWKARSDRVFQILARHQNLLIIGFRFLYGLRTVTPFVIGMSGVSYWRFTLLNSIGAGVWAASIGLVGYYFGRAAEILLGDVKHYEVEIMTTIAGFAILIWLVHYFRTSRSGKASTKK